LKSLGVAAAKCQMLPYGIDTTRFRPRDQPREGDGLNLLFNGAVGLRKGVPYLLEALRRLDSRNIHCRLVGPLHIQPDRLRQYAKWIEVVGPIPRAEIMRMYRWADALVLPSIAEGSALVTYESLASGLPVITTPNAGSVVRDYIDGFIVPIRDTDALARRLEQLLRERDLLSTMSHAALARRDDLGLEAYNARILDLIRSVHLCAAP
jgi:glycosyltransferase involved in cell wall biosynthesis